MTPRTLTVSQMPSGGSPILFSGVSLGPRHVRVPRSSSIGTVIAGCWTRRSGQRMRAERKRQPLLHGVVDGSSEIVCRLEGFATEHALEISPDVLVSETKRSDV